MRIVSVIGSVVLAGCMTASHAQRAPGRAPQERGALEAKAEAQVEDLLGKDDERGAFKHGLREPGETVAAARRRINGWIRYLLLGPAASMSGSPFMSFSGTPTGGALGAKASGDMHLAYFYYYRALHVLRHAALPASNDANGDPAIFAPPVSRYHAAPRSRYWRDRIEEDMRRMFDTGVIPEGDLLRMYGIDTDSGPVSRPNQLPRPALMAGASPSGAVDYSGSWRADCDDPMDELRLTRNNAGLYAVEICRGSECLDVQFPPTTLRGDPRFEVVSPTHIRLLGKGDAMDYTKCTPAASRPGVRR
jgi:hypothetical protein